MYLDKYIIKFRRVINHIRLRNREITLLTQNCIGGVLYAEYKIPFQSPTINMFIEGENFVKLVERFRYYMEIPAQPLCECYVDPIDSSVRYPKIKIDDIEICCLHYKNCEEAVDAWNRRRVRVNLEKVFVIANSWNMHEDRKLIERVCQCEYPVICFTYHDYGIKNCIPLKEDYWRLDKRGILRPNLTDYIPGKIYRYYESLFDFTSWFNTNEATGNLP